MIFEIKNQNLKGVVANFKVATSTLAREIIRAHHPEVEESITTPHGDGNGAAYPDGKNSENSQWHGQCPKLSEESEGPVALLLRDPIDRFVSACHQIDASPQEVIDGEFVTRRGRKIGFNNPHFRPQAELLADVKKTREVHLYRFPDGLDELAEDCGLGELPVINDGESKDHEKPVLTSDQIEALKVVYADDIAWFESSEKIVPADEPPTAEELEEARLAAMTPHERHKERLQNGFEYKGKFLPCLKDDRDGINAVIAGFQTADRLFKDWIIKYGPPKSEAETENMIESGAIPPEYRMTEFEWSNGEFLTVTPAIANEIAGRMSLFVSRSFIQKKNDTIPT